MGNSEFNKPWSWIVAAPVGLIAAFLLSAEFALELPVRENVRGHDEDC